MSRTCTDSSSLPPGVQVVVDALVAPLTGSDSGWSLLYPLADWSGRTGHALIVPWPEYGEPGRVFWALYSAGMRCPFGVMGTKGEPEVDRGERQNPWPFSVEHFPDCPAPDVQDERPSSVEVFRKLTVTQDGLQFLNLRGIDYRLTTRGYEHLLTFLEKEGV